MERAPKQASASKGGGPSIPHSGILGWIALRRNSQAAALQDGLGEWIRRL